MKSKTPKHITRGRTMRMVFLIIGLAFFFGVTALELYLFLGIDGTPLMLIGMLAIFQVVGIVFLILYIRKATRASKEQKAYNFGKPTKATVVSTRSNTTLNGERLYSLELSFDADGKDTNHKTQDVFTRDEADYLKALGQIETKHLNGAVAVTEDTSHEKMDAYYAEVHTLQIDNPPDQPPVLTADYTFDDIFD